MKAEWVKLPFVDAILDESGGNVKTPQSQFLTSGRFAVVDQGKNMVSGYVNTESSLCKASLPVIVFGDHTRCFKFVDFPFCMGADGVKVLRPKVDADVKYLFYYLRQISLPDGGYDRHFKYLKRSDVLLPPLEEQKRIAEILDQAEELRRKRKGAIAQLDTLTQSIFLEMFGDPSSKNQRYPKRLLGEFCKIDSPLVDPKLPEYENLPHIGPDRIEKNTGKLLEAKTAKEDGLTSVKFLFESDCILYSKIRPYLNKVALASMRGLCSADMYPLTVCSEIASREFIWYLLLSEDF